MANQCTSDIVVKVGRLHNKYVLSKLRRSRSTRWRLCKSTEYNVSTFLHEHDSSDTDVEDLNNFIQKVDKQVHVDASDPKYNHIYRGVDIIMKRLVNELSKVDSFFC